VQLLGYARDGVPMVQIYFYQADYIHLLTQEIVEDCYRTYLRAHPDHVVVLPKKAYIEEEEEGSVCWSEEEGVGGGADESGIGTGSEGEEDDEDWSQQVQTWSEADSTLATNCPPVGYTEDAATYTPVYQPEEVIYGTEEMVHPAYYVPEPCLPILYYVADPSGACFYPVVAAPIYPMEGEIHPMIMQEQHSTEVYSHEVEARDHHGEVYDHEWVGYSHTEVEEDYSHTEVEDYSHTEVEDYSHTEVEDYSHTEVEEEYSHTEVEEEYSDTEVEEYSHSEEAAVHSHNEVKESSESDSGLASSDESVENDYESLLAELESKPYEEWSQEDYELYYQLH
jgi:hypothetical protein